MKSVLRNTAAGLALATVGFASSASAATTDNAQVTAEILSTLSILAVSGDSVLDFGQIADAGLTGNSTVAVSAAGVRSCGANLACSGTVNAPSFTVAGLAGSVVAVTLPTSAVLTLPPGPVPAGMDSDLSVGSFTTNLAANPVTLATGTTTFSMGGTLTVSPLQAPGTYTGTVAVSVAYN
jgi:hypothetical protein